MPDPKQPVQPMSRRRGRDLGTRPLPLQSLSWKPEDCEQSLMLVFKHVRNHTLEAIAWYVRARTPKRRVAYGARFLAIVLVGVAGFLPLVEGTLVPNLNPLWITIAIAAGGGALAFDRALGSSSGWIRCIKTEMQLRDALQSFELEWEADRATWQGKPPQLEQVRGMLRRARTFAAQMNAIVQEETNAWVEEFKSSIRQIDESLRARAAEARSRAETARTGAVNLTVTNGDQCDGGWKLMVDDGAERVLAGRTAAIGALAPGIRVFRVSGLIAGASKQAEVAATVPVGGAANAEVTLT